MEKRVMGIVLSVLGIVGLILAGYNFLNGSGGRNTKEVILYGLLGAIFFFSGVGLIRSSSDTTTRR